MAATGQGPAAPGGSKDTKGRPGLIDGILEGIFEALIATEVGLVLLGILAMAVAVPILIVLAGGAAAAHMRRKDGSRDRAGRVALLVAGALALLTAGALLVSYEAVHTGHPVVVTTLAVGACAVGAAVGIMVRNRKERQV